MVYINHLERSDFLPVSYYNRLYLRTWLQYYNNYISWYIFQIPLHCNRMRLFLQPEWVLLLFYLGVRVMSTLYEKMYMEEVEKEKTTSNKFKYSCKIQMCISQMWSLCLDHCTFVCILFVYFKQGQLYLFVNLS